MGQAAVYTSGAKFCLPARFAPICAHDPSARSVFFSNSEIVPKMSFLLYDFKNYHGENEFKAWTKGLQKKERAKLNAKLDLLEQHGRDLFPRILTGTPTPGILKLRASGNVELRPMLCYGPIDIDSEFSLLFGATERDDEFDPPGADQSALERKELIQKDPDNRRCIHERVS